MWTNDTLLDALQPARLAIVSGTPKKPRNRIVAWTSSGIWEVRVKLPAKLPARMEIQQALKNWLHYRQAAAITVLTYIPEPSGVMCVGLKWNDEDEQLVCRAVVDWYDKIVDRTIFSGPEWLGRQDVEDDIVELLPTRTLKIDAQAMKALADASIEGRPIWANVLSSNRSMNS